jgi:hypothetical protein
MAKKSKTRQKTSRAQPRGRQASPGPRRRHQRLILGGIILVLVIGIGVFVRYRQQQQIPPRLQGAIENHYTHGVAGAPVVVKEFSDYG